MNFIQYRPKSVGPSLSQDPHSHNAMHGFYCIYNLLSNTYNTVSKDQGKAYLTPDITRQVALMLKCKNLFRITNLAGLVEAEK